jgi:peptidyl-dipeptidase Dcp
LSLHFILAETNAFEMHLTDEKILPDYPRNYRSSRSFLKQKRKKRRLDFHLRPSQATFMTYADNRELRKKLAIAFGARGFQNNEFDNQEIVLKSLNFVLNAQLLVTTYAHFVLEERMAESPEKVLSFFIIY